MNNKVRRFLLTGTLLVLGSGACAPQAAATVIAPTVAPTLAPTTAPSATLPPTATVVASPTALPGEVTLPLDSLKRTVPWQPLDKAAVPASYFYGFNLSKPPFDNVLVRQALAAAIDREAIAAIATKYGAKNARPATTLTPPETLGRDLYNEVGIPYDPARARELLAQAGYSDPSTFPTVKILTNATGQPAPGVHFQIADAIIKMWRENLGIDATVDVITWAAFLERVQNDPPDVYRLSWLADYNDPDNFMQGIFGSGAEANYGGYNSREFDSLVSRAGKSGSPGSRQALYIQAERLLTETDAAVIPLYHMSVKQN